MRRLVLVVLVVGGFVAWPYYTARSLKAAFLSGDEFALALNVDFDSVKGALLRHVTEAHTFQETNAVLAGPGFSNRPGLLSFSEEDRIAFINEYARSEAIAALGRQAATNRAWSAHLTRASLSSLRQFDVRLTNVDFTAPLVQKSWITPATVSLSVPEVRLCLRFANLEWRLTGIELPHGAFCEVRPLSRLAFSEPTARPRDTAPAQVDLFPTTPTVASATPPSKPVSWTGTWRLSDRQSVSFTQVGDSISGAVLPEGFSVRGAVHGRRLTATCSVGRETARLELTLRPDDDSFSGTLRYASSWRSYSWDGQRISENPSPVPVTTAERTTRPRIR